MQALEDLHSNDPATLHFSAVFHYIKTFIEKQSLALMVHLAFIAIAGVLWPLQVSADLGHHCHIAFHKCAVLPAVHNLS